MVLGFTRTQLSPIAVDFGVDSLKVLQLEENEPPKMLAAAAVDLPDYARTDANARGHFMAETLRELVKSQGFRGKRVICSIPAGHSLIQQFQVPRTADADLMDHVNMNLRQRFNVDPTRLVVRCFPVEAGEQAGGSQQEVICVAVSRDVVLRHIRIAQLAKLDVVGMHCEQLAALKAFSHLYRRKDSNVQTTCFVDIGAATTKVVIAHGMQMAFAKTIHAGGDQFTKYLSETEKITFAEAREKRITEVQQTIPERRGSGKAPAADGTVETPPRREDLAMTEIASGDSSGQAKLSVDNDTVVGVVGKQPVNDTLDCLIDELQMCIRYHRSRFNDRPIDKLVFLGGESKRAETCQEIARALRISAQLGDPMARMTRSSKAKPPYGVDLRQPQPGWAVPMGLCLSEANL